MKSYKYECIQYDIGDKVVERHPEDIKNNPILEIELTKLTKVGSFAVQVLKFKGVDGFINISNHFKPAEETIDKYKNGFVYAYLTENLPKERRVSSSPSFTPKIPTSGVTKPPSP